MSDDYLKLSEYVHRPVVIKAIQWRGVNFKEIEELLGSDSAQLDDKVLRVEVLRGPIDHNPVFHLYSDIEKVEIGDWLIQGIHGYFYLCRKEEFDKLYTTKEKS